MKIFSIFIVLIVSIACQNNKTDKTTSVIDKIETPVNDSIKKDSIAKKVDEDYIKDSITSSKMRIKVTRVSGWSDDGEVKAEYRSIHERVKDLKKTAELEMWEPKRYKSWIESDKSLHPGGEMSFSIIRSSKLAADSENFDIIIQDKDGKEITRKEHYKGSPSSTYKINNWSNRSRRNYYSGSRTGAQSYVERKNAKRQARMNRSTALRPIGKTVIKESPKRKPFKLGKNKWLNSEVITLDEKINFPFYAYVIDKYNQVRFKYKVDIANKK